MARFGGRSFRTTDFEFMLCQTCRFRVALVSAERKRFFKRIKLHDLQPQSRLNSQRVLTIDQSFKTLRSKENNLDLSWFYDAALLTES